MDAFLCVTLRLCDSVVNLGFMQSPWSPRKGSGVRFGYGGYRGSATGMTSMTVRTSSATDPACSFCMINWR